MLKAIRVTCLALVTLFPGFASAVEANVCAIVRNPNSFDHEKVDLQGLAGDIKETTSHKGNDYTTFNLIDPSGCGAAKVFAWGHPQLGTGCKVRVEGIFETQHHEGRYTFLNEVQATTVTAHCAAQ